MYPWLDSDDGKVSETLGAGQLTTGDDILRRMSMEKIRDRLQVRQLILYSLEYYPKCDNTIWYELVVRDLSRVYW